MTKADLVEGGARPPPSTRGDAELLVEIALEGIIEALNRGEKVELRGFGSFRVRTRDARRGRNPKTGAAIEIPAKCIPYFKPGKELRRVINGDPAGAAASRPGEG